MRERLWILLLPGLLVLSIVGATLASHHLRTARENEATERLERRMQRAVHGLSPDVARSFEFGDRERQKLLVDALAKSFGGRCLLLDRSGVLVVKSGKDDLRLTPLPESGPRVRHGNVLGEVLAWEPIRAMGGTRIGELRLHVPLPPRRKFPWALWSGILAAFSLISAGVMMLVTRVLAPVGRLGQFFRDLAEVGPLGVSLMKDGFSEFAQLRDEMEICLESLGARQLRTEESFVEVALRLAREYECRRDGIVGHGQRTRRYASWLAERLRMKPEERDILEIAALCHDIGRPPVNEDLPWDREGNLDLKHPELGAAMFESMPGLRDVASLIRHHHENYDGSGYPAGLKGEEIPLGARILRIADSLERLRAGGDGVPMNSTEALQIMSEDIGIFYDPALFQYFRDEVTTRMVERKSPTVTFKPVALGGIDVDFPR